MIQARGRFITFEGGEGAGKSTQVRLLAQRLRALGISVITTREPGGSPRAEKIRDFILSGQAKAFGEAGEAALFSAARADHIEILISPALKRGDWVVCDRFADSTRAYQGAMGGLKRQFVECLQQAATGGLIPDATFLLDLPAETGLARAKARSGGADRFESEGLEFHQRLRDVFLKLAHESPRRFFIVDAAQSLEAVSAQIWILAREKFALGHAQAGTA